MNQLYSYSKLNTFGACPQQFKIIYLDKIRKNNESIEAFMGKRVHEVLEWLYQIDDLKNQYIVFDKLLNKYNELWNEKSHKNIFIARCKYNKNSYNKNTLYKIGAECLKNYYSRFNKNGYFKEKVVAVEKEFQIKIGNYLFKGFIDRIDQTSDGFFEIIDYKTSKKSKTYFQAKNDFQLAIYCLAVRELFTEYKKINLNLYYLRTNEIVHFEADIDKISILKNKIIKRVLDINNETNFIAKESLLCEWCHYWEECNVKVTKNPSIRVL